MKNTFDLVLYGHEGWVEEYPSHYHAGDPVMAKLLWGHSGEVDGMADISILKFEAFSPEGKYVEISDVRRNDEDKCIDLVLDSELEGFYTIVVTYDNSYGVYNEADGKKRWKRGDLSTITDADEVKNYYQTYTTTISVGHHHDIDLSYPQDKTIMLVPTAGPHYNVGQEIEFKLTIHNQVGANRKLELVEEHHGHVHKYEAETDANGICSLTFDSPGNFLLICREESDYSEIGKYDSQSLTTSFSFSVHGAEYKGHHH